MLKLTAFAAACACARAFSPANSPTMGLRTFVKSKMGLSAMPGRGQGRGGLYDDVTQTIGNTPVVKISDKLCPPGVSMYAKCEYFNPLSSVKDRLALAIIEDAEKEGRLKPGDTVVEATSGNTGIAVAMVCAQRGYDCVICMAEPFSVERRKCSVLSGKC
jgi:cysteine synthase A